MRKQTYGDKQREAQRLKKQEGLSKKSSPEGEPEPETPADQTDQAAKKNDKKPAPRRRSA